MKLSDLKNIVDQFNRRTLGVALGLGEIIGPDVLPAGDASIVSPATSPDRSCDCFCGKTSKDFKSGQDFVQTCLTLSDSQGQSGSVVVGAVIDKPLDGTNDEDLPVVLAVGINYGQGGRYLRRPVPLLDRTGMRPKLSKVQHKLADTDCPARSLKEPFHLVAANFFPWITPLPWSAYSFNSIEEAALLFCCGHSDPEQYILELMRAVLPSAVVFHGANNVVPYMGTSVVRRHLAGSYPLHFETIFSDNLAGSYQPGISNAIRHGCSDPTRATMATAAFDE